MAHLAEIWRYPIKSHGCESMGQIRVNSGQSLPLDRAWAVTHSDSQADGNEWASCSNFSRGAKAPSLMAIDAKWSDTRNELTLTHPDKAPIVFNPDIDGDKLIEWTQDFIPKNRSQSKTLVRAVKSALTDTSYPSISIGNLASNEALGNEIGTSLSVKRWRANLWISGLKPWEEFEWINKQIQIGSVHFNIKERIKRCLATTANPETGKRDIDTLDALSKHGHQNFCVYAVALNDGDISVGDNFKVL